MENSRKVVWNSMSLNERKDFVRDMAILAFLLSGVIFFKEPFNGICLVAFIPFLIWQFTKALKENAKCQQT